jgi:hypothetical protein
MIRQSWRLTTWAVWETIFFAAHPVLSYGEYLTPVLRNFIHPD